MMCAIEGVMLVGRVSLANPKYPCSVSKCMLQPNQGDTENAAIELREAILGETSRQLR